MGQSGVKRAKIAGYTALVMTGILLHGRSASAQSASDRSLAEALFQEGKALLVKDLPEQACPKFEESQRLDPGGGTQLLLGLCWEQVGRTASAWVELNEALATAKRDGNDNRAAVAEQHLKAIQPRLMRVRFMLSPEVEEQKPSLVLDGGEVPEAAWSVPLPLDPGEHVLVVSAPGHITEEVSFTMAGEGSLAQVEVPVLRAYVEQEGAQETGHSAEIGNDATAVAANHRKLIPWGYVLGGAGVVGVGVGSYFGVRAIGLKNELDDACPDVRCPRPDLEPKQKQEKNAATLSTVFIGVGAAALVTGTVLLIVGYSPKSSQTATSEVSVRKFDVAPVAGGSTLLLSGEF